MAESATDRAEQLAIEYLQALEDEGTAQVEDYRGRLEGEDERAAFDQAVADAGAAAGLLPAQVGPGRRLDGRYRILREIGAGGMGKVFEARDEQLGRKVAVKVLAALQTTALDPQEMFMKESRLLAALQHPNIVAVHEAGRDGDVSYLVMDLVDGTPLHEVLEAVGDGARPREGAVLERAIGRPQPEGISRLIEPGSWFRSVARIIAEVARTLEAAHGQGVVHRDIKPGNILLRGGGAPVVLDFGLAGTVEAEAGAVTRGLFGSVAYLAPEQAASNQVGIDRRTDVYQLGVVLYECLTLRRAFDGKGVTQLLQNISTGQFPLPRSVDRGVPADLEAICLKAMEVNPDARYQSARELREDLERYLSGVEAPVAARGGPIARIGRNGRYFVRRHRVAAAILVALLAGGSVGAWNVARDAGDPLRIEPYRYDDASGSIDWIAHGDPVRKGDTLGVKIETPEPMYIYALSIFGEFDEPTWVLAMEPQVVGREDEEGGDDAVTRDGWGVRVPADTATYVNCTRIDETDASIPSEGLLVFASPTPVPDLDEWMDRLRRMERYAAEDDKGVAWERARAALQRGPDVVRGARVEQTADERARQLQAITEAQLLADEDWPLGDLRRKRFSFRVDI